MKERVHPGHTIFREGDVIIGGVCEIEMKSKGSWAYHVFEYSQNTGEFPLKELSFKIARKR